MTEDHDSSSSALAESSGVDVLSDVLRSVRLTGSMLFLVDASAPWMSWAPETEAFRKVVLPASQHMISYHVVTQGGCWAGLCDGSPERFEAGDVLVIPHGDAYYLCDPPGAERAYGRNKAVDFFRQMAAGEMPTTIVEGGGGPCTTRLICGFLGCDVRPLNPVLSALPRVVHVRAAMRPGDRMHHLIEFALAELAERRAGSRSVLLRLAELMFVEVARRHIDTIPSAQTGWLAGLRDPVVGRALALLHGAPAQAWTLPALASRAGTSRSVLAERFVEVVGQPPMQYLAQWRMQLATRILVEPGVKILAVAEAIGYDSEAAFSRAFKKSMGVSPAEWRRRQTRS